MYAKKYSPGELELFKEFYPHWDQLMVADEFEGQIVESETLMYLDRLYQSSRSLVQQELFLGTFRLVDDTELYTYHQLTLALRNQLRGIYNDLRLNHIERIETDLHGNVVCFIKDTVIIKCHIDQLIHSLDLIAKMHDFKPLLLQTVTKGKCAQDKLAHFQKRPVRKITATPTPT